MSQYAILLDRCWRILHCSLLLYFIYWQYFFKFSIFTKFMFTESDEVNLKNENSYFNFILIFLIKKKQSHLILWTITVLFLFFSLFIQNIQQKHSADFQKRRYFNLYLMVAFSYSAVSSTLYVTPLSFSLLTL